MAMTRQELLEYSEHMKQDEKDQESFFAFYWVAGIISALLATFFGKAIFYPLCPILWFMSGMHKQKVWGIRQEQILVEELIQKDTETKEPCHDA